MVCRVCVRPLSHPERMVSRAGNVTCGHATQACGRAVAALHCCRLPGVASHGSQSQSCSEGLSSSAAEGAPRLMQGMEQAMDVQMADVQCDQEPQDEACGLTRLRSRWCPLLFSPCRSSPSEVETAQPMQIDMATPRAGEGEPQGSAEAPGSHSQRSAGQKSSYWSWRRHCQPCEPSGTSYGA